MKKHTWKKTKNPNIQVCETCGCNRFTVKTDKWRYGSPLFLTKYKFPGEQTVFSLAPKCIPARELSTEEKMELWQSICSHNGARITNTGTSGSKCALCGKEMMPPNPTQET